MRDIAVDVLLACAVLGAWLGALGFVRLRTRLDRLHCIAFVNVACMGPLAAAAFVADGVSSRAIKIALILAASLLIGAATAQETGRALRERGSAP